MTEIFLSHFFYDYPHINHASGFQASYLSVPVAVWQLCVTLRLALAWIVCIIPGVDTLHIAPALAALRTDCGQSSRP